MVGFNFISVFVSYNIYVCICTQIQNDFAIAGARSGDKRFYLLHLYRGCLAFGAGAFYYINKNDPTVVNDSDNNPTNYKINANQRYKFVSDFSEGQQTISVDGSVVYTGNHADGINLDMDFYLLAVNQDGYDKCGASSGKRGTPKQNGASDP